MAIYYLHPTPFKTSLLQQPGPNKFKLSKIELTYKAKKSKVPPVHYLRVNPKP